MSAGSATGRQHLFTVPANGSDGPRQITAGEWQDGAPAWSPDGATLAFVSARQTDWDTEPVTDIYLVDASGGDDEPLRLTQGGGTVELPSWSPDGQRLAVLRYPGVFDDPRHTQVAVVDAATGALTLLTTQLDRNCGTYPSLREPLWDGAHLVFVVEDQGNVHLYRVAVNGTAAPELLVGGEREVTGYDIAAGRLAFAATGPTSASELFAFEAVGGHDARRLTHVGDAFAAGRELVEPERFTAVSADGTEVEAWVMRPAGAKGGEKYPALLNIHAGPSRSTATALVDEFQVEAGHGYAIVYCNPPARRASARHGAGPSAARARRPRLGHGRLRRLPCGHREAVERFDFIDPQRLG